MRRVKVDLICGWHKAVKDEDVEAVGEWEITVGRGKARLVAACGDCMETWIMPLQAAMEAEPVAESVTERRPPTTTVPRTRAPWSTSKYGRGISMEDFTDCIEPGCGYQANARNTLGTHVRTVHEKSLNDYNWAAEVAKRGKT